MRVTCHGAEEQLMGVEAERVAAIEREPFRENFDTFYQAELQPVVGLAYVLSGSRSAAEDLAQDGFVAAYRHWERISSFDDPGAWVRRVVANRAVSVFRRRSAEMRALLRMHQPNFTLGELPQESDLVWAEVRRLPKRQRQVIALRYLDAQKVSQIARILECSDNTVKTHLRRAKQTLAEKLGQEFRP